MKELTERAEFDLHSTRTIVWCGCLGEADCSPTLLGVVGLLSLLGAVIGECREAVQVGHVYPLQQI